MAPARRALAMCGCPRALVVVGQLVVGVAWQRTLLGERDLQPRWRQRTQRIGRGDGEGGGVIAKLRCPYGGR